MVGVAFTPSLNLKSFYEKVKFCECCELNFRIKIRNVQAIWREYGYTVYSNILINLKQKSYLICANLKKFYEKNFPIR